MRSFTTLLLYTTFLLSTLTAQPEIDFNPLTLSGPTITQPVDITGSGDGSGRLFVVEKRGTIRILQGTTVLSSFFLDIQGQVMNSGERGLLGLAFHPDFPTTPYFYVNYVVNGTIRNRISRFTVNPNNENDAQESTELIMLEVTGVQSNHKAGDIAFGPDGYLYIGFGDGGGGGDPAETAQNLDTLLGKIVRIDVNTTTGNLNYGIPPTNPFVNLPGDDEIWAFGVRNPWRISFDRETGDLWIGDVGQNLWEEIDYVPAGTAGGINFGWDCYEGTHVFESSGCGGIVHYGPIYEYPHSGGGPTGASLTGGFVYRGEQYPLLQGWYICADYLSNWIWLIEPDAGGGAPDVIAVQGNSLINDLVAFGESDIGELFATSLLGTIYQVTEESSLPLQWTDFGAKRITSGPKPGNKIDWTIQLLNGIDHFSVERSLTPEFIEPISLGHIPPVQDQYNYTYTDIYNQSIGVYYRAVAYMQDGQKEYSPIARLLPDALATPALVYDADDKIWRISLPDVWQSGELILLDLQGKEVLRKNLSSSKMVDLGPPIVPGAYFIQIKTGAETWSEKVVL